jgi:hypothetical protein
VQSRALLQELLRQAKAMFFLNQLNHLIDYYHATTHLLYTRWSQERAGHAATVLLVKNGGQGVRATEKVDYASNYL